MKRRKFILGSTATLATGGLLTGTGAFSSAETERDITIEVVGDRDAYLGLDDEEMQENDVLFGDGLPRTEPESFKIRNQSATDISEMTVTLLDGDLEFMGSASSAGRASVTVDDTDDNDDTLRIENLSPGETVTDVNIRTSGEVNGTVSDQLLFEVDGPGLSIEATRTLELKPLVESVWFSGTGSVHFRSNAGETFDMVYWVASQMQADSEDDGGQNGGNEGDESDENEENQSEGDGQNENDGDSDNEGAQVPSTGEIQSYERHVVRSFHPDDGLNGRRDGGPGYVAVYIPAIGRSYYHPQFEPEADRISQWGQGPQNAIQFDGAIL